MPPGTPRFRAARVGQVKVAAEAARRFLFARHFLAPARSVGGGLDGVLEVFRTFGSIQFDPIAVAGRNHDLVLHARVADYEPAWCDVFYERREIFETTNKALSLVPASEFPWFRLGFGRKGPRFHAAILAENTAVAERVLGRIRAEGALSALDFEPEHGAPKDWFGMPENVVRAVLEAYTVTGAIGLARRAGNRRYYDLLERLLPAGAGTCSRSASATASSAGSNRGSTGTGPASRCSTSGGRTASRHNEPTGSSTRCATPSARTCASRARKALSGHRTSPPSSGSSPPSYFRGRELADDEKVPVLRAYLKRWKAEVGIFFEGTGPDSSDDQLRAISPRHPAFEVLPVS